jgi:hypothetical protein
MTCDHSCVRATSILCVAVALVVCAWFAIGAMQAIDTQRATAIVTRGATATAAQVREVRSLVRDARFLNPDRQPEVLLGQIEVERHHYAQARRVLEPVILSEPENLQAWLFLAETANRDHRLLRQALQHLHTLEPRVP